MTVRMWVRRTSLLRDYPVAVLVVEQDRVDRTPCGCGQHVLVVVTAWFRHDCLVLTVECKRFSGKRKTGRCADAQLPIDDYFRDFFCGAIGISIPR